MDAAKIPIYLIHYTRLRDRRDRMMRQLSANSLSAQVVEQFDREDLTPDILALWYSRSEIQWDEMVSLVERVFVENILFNPNKKSWSEDMQPVDMSWKAFKPMRLAEISCSLKHFAAYQSIVERNEDFALVLEDDTIFSDSFASRLEEILAETAPGWDLIFLGDGCRFRVPERHSEQTIYRMLPPRSKCMDSYFISQKCARQMLADGKPFVFPIGWLMQAVMLQREFVTYWIDPPIVSQGSQSGAASSATNLPDDVDASYAK